MQGVAGVKVCVAEVKVCEARVKACVAVATPQDKGVEVCSALGASTRKYVAARAMAQALQ
jgi:hypothetical protein